MITQILILLFSLFLVVFSANYLVDGASSVAKKMGMSEFLIGMLIVGLGTSLPELVVSLVGAFENNTDVSLGNIIGSNIFNTGAILGISALIAPIIVTKRNSERDIPFMLMSTTLFVLFGLTKGGINRIEGVLLILLFVLYITYLLNTDKNNNGVVIEEQNTLMFNKLWVAITIVVASIIGLICSGKMFVDSAVKLGTMLGISDKIIGITILAFGTSLPEFATCLTAIFKKRAQMALGDIVGSNIFNILLIIGSASLIHPLGFGNITVVDLLTLMVCMLIVYISQHTRHKGTITRFDGGCMVVMFVIYIYLLFTIK